MELIIAFPPPAPDGVHRGGSLIIVDTRQLTVRSTPVVEAGLVTAEVEWGGVTFNLASLYAPAKAPERLRFLDGLAAKLTKDTILGGDFNCVPDVTLDVFSRNPLGYANQGATKLAEEMEKVSLADERRTQLGNERELTRAGTTRNGQIGTRIDRWYTPTTGSLKDMLWEFAVTNQFTFKKKASDHYGVILTMENQNGELGHDRQTIREELILDREIQEGILAVARRAYAQLGSNAKRWSRMMVAIKDYLMRETAARRKKEAVEMTRVEGILGVLKQRITKHGPTERTVEAERRLQKKLYELKYPETKELPTDVSAYNMYERSEVTSRAQFSPYKEQAKQQWINEVHKAEWKEDVPPVFVGKTNHTKEVAGEFVKYYKMLLDDKDINEGCARILLRRLAKTKILEASASKLDEDMTVEEVLETMENLPVGKQAGPNRVPNAVFKYMSHFFAPKLCKVLNDSTRRGVLPKHFLQGDISMMYKKGDRADPRNYRPITLLNTDYKIFTRILAKRMQKIDDGGGNHFLLQVHQDIIYFHMQYFIINIDHI